MNFLPSVIRAEYRGGYRIHVTFNDNSEKTINFREWLKSPVFEPLKAPNRFRNFFLDGGTVAWPSRLRLRARRRRLVAFQGARSRAFAGFSSSCNRDQRP